MLLSEVAKAYKPLTDREWDARWALRAAALSPERSGWYRPALP